MRESGGAEWPVLDSSERRLEVRSRFVDSPDVEILNSYRKQALKLAVVEPLGGGEGYAARIPGFGGLIGTGQTKKETMADLDSALAGWIELALKRGMGLPAVAKSAVEVVSAA